MNAALPPARVLMLSNSPTLGGAELYVRNVAQGLRALDDEVQVVASSASPLPPLLGAAGVPFRRAPLGVYALRARGYAGTLATLAPGGYRAWRRAVAPLVAAMRPDVLLAQDTKEQLYAARLGRELGLPIVWIMHSPLHFPAMRLVLLRCLRRAAGDVARIVCVSAALRSTLAAAGFPADRLTVAPPPKDLTALPPPGCGAAIRAEFAIPSSAPLALVASRLEPKKAVDRALRAVAALAGDWPDLHLIVAGSGREAASLAALAATLGIADRVHVSGFRGDVPVLLDAADVVMVPTMDPGEGLPTILVEALAMRRPVVAAAVGGVPEIVLPERTGVLVPPGDVPALARGLHRLLGEPALRAALGRNGRALVEQQFSLAAVATRLSAILREAAAVGPARALQPTLRTL